MKKTYIAMIMTAILCLTACGKPTEVAPTEEETTQNISSETEDESTEDEAGEPDTEAAEAVDPSSLSAGPRLNITTNYYDAGENNYEYITGTYPAIEVMGDDYPELKDAVTAWASSYTDGYMAQAQEYLNNAKIDAENAGENFYNYSLDYSAKTVRADNRVTCLAVSEYAYTGGAHGYDYLYGVTFDTQTGTEIVFEDLGDIRAEVRTYVDAYINEKRNDGYTFDFYETAIEDYMNAPVWYLDGLGLNIIFNAYDIASYAAGRIVVSIPYDKLENFNPDYKPEGTAIFAEMSANTISVDVTGDGTPETIGVITEYTEDGDTLLNLKVNDLSLDLGRCSYLSGAYFARTQEGRAFVLISCDMMSDDYVTQLVEITSGTPVNAGTTDGNLIGITSDVCTIRASLYVLGTYIGQRSFTFSNGAFEPVEERYTFADDRQSPDRSGIVLTKALTVSVNDNGTLTQTDLTPGTTLYPINTDGTSVMGFELEDGTEGEIQFERKDDGMIYINGVSEFDLFEQLPYVG